MPRSDLTGQRFGRLVVERFDSKDAKRNARWFCRCDCGNSIVAPGYNLKSGNTSSCGCLRTEQLVERTIAHGHAAGPGSPEYESWAAMLARVRATSGRRFEDYGARGIKVATRWLSFENFLADMGLRPPGTSLDRVNNNGHYEPGNCRWATASEQRLNQRPRSKASKRAPAAPEITPPAAPKEEESHP